MNLQPVIAALQALPELKQVQFGADLAGREDIVEQYPSVYVAPMKEISTEVVNATGCVLQSVDQQFITLTVCMYADLEAAREAMLGALIGLPLYPSGNISPIEFVEGEQVEGTGTLVWWRDIYVARKQRRFTT